MEGNAAWVLISAALVLLMTPGLAFFYGGMVRSKSVLNIMMMSFGAIGLIGVLWVLYGYSTAFSTDDLGGLLGNPIDELGLRNIVDGTDVANSAAFVAFQGMFAIITVALISGAIADRARFGAWMVFAGLWATIVYFPVAHWVWGLDAEGEPAGWIISMGTIDFAGGTAVHINSGAAALALALVLGKRKGWPREPMKPHNLPFVMLGAALLWFGWFGFNAGSALAADKTAGLAFVNTLAATCAGLLGWLVLERFRDGKATSLGAASGIVAGLVAITPACAAVAPWAALIIGFLAGVVCALAVSLKYKLGYDDSLDVVGIHLVGGVFGTLMIGIVGVDVGLVYGGGLEQLGVQIVGAGAVAVFSFAIAYLIGFGIQKTIGFRVTEEVEVTGIDEAEHAEVAYELGVTRGGRSGVATGASGKKLEESKA